MPIPTVFRSEICSPTTLNPPCNGYLHSPHLTGKEAVAQRNQAVSEAVPRGASFPIPLLHLPPGLASRMPSNPTLPAGDLPGIPSTQPQPRRNPEGFEADGSNTIPIQPNLGCQGANWLLRHELALKRFQSSLCERTIN